MSYASPRGALAQSALIVKCRVEGCPLPRRERASLCTTHSSRRQRHGGTAAYAKRPGPQILDRHVPYRAPNGYLRVSFCFADMYVHRLVWALGNGPIPAGHHIHHVDGNKLNNAPDNLVSMPAEEHLRLHRNEEVG